MEYWKKPKRYSVKSRKAVVKTRLPGYQIQGWSGHLEVRQRYMPKAHSVHLQIFIKIPTLCQAPTLLSVAGNTAVNRGEKVLALLKFPFLDFDSTEILLTYFLCQLFDREFPPDKHMIHKLQSSQANWKSLRDTVETNSCFRYSGG